MSIHLSSRCTLSINDGSHGRWNRKLGFPHSPASEGGSSTGHRGSCIEFPVSICVLLWLPILSSYPLSLPSSRSLSMVWESCISSRKPQIGRAVGKHTHLYRPSDLGCHSLWLRSLWIWKPNQLLQSGLRYFSLEMEALSLKMLSVTSLSKTQSLSPRSWQSSKNNNNNMHLKDNMF